MDNAVGETFIPDDAIADAIAPAVRDLNTIYGTATGLKELTFTATRRASRTMTFRPRWGRTCTRS
jgi:hypothetical protein